MPDPRPTKASLAVSESRIAAEEKVWKSIFQFTNCPSSQSFTYSTHSLLILSQAKPTKFCMKRFQNIPAKGNYAQQM